MLTFPDPNVETEYTDPNGSVWEFNGTGWVRQCDCPDGGSGGPNGPGDNVDFSLVRLLVNGEDSPEGDKNYSTWDKSGNATTISYAPSSSGCISSNAKYGARSIVTSVNPDVDPTVASGYFKLGEHDVGSFSWAFEFWASHPYNGAESGMRQVCGKWTNNSTSGRAWQLNYTRSTGMMELLHSPSGNSFSRLSAAINIEDKKWHHYAVAYNSPAKTLTFFHDGVKLIEITDCDPIDPIAGAGREWHVGGVNLITDPNAMFGAYFDDIRLTVGTPVYTENFTPPGELATSARARSNDFVSRPWTDDSNEMGGDNDADLSNTLIQTNDSEEF